ncbi:hypothetical protein N9N67_09545 [Bacteriovoracaceae bacterium]|nr:hypothetical protein [Bacteriovoracaceae bacterium]
MKKILFVLITIASLSSAFAQLNPLFNRFNFGASAGKIDQLGTSFCAKAQAHFVTGSENLFINDVAADLEWGLIIYDDNASGVSGTGRYYSLDALISYETKLVDIMTGLGVQSDWIDTTEEQVFYFPIEVCSNDLISLGYDTSIDFAIGTDIFPDLKATNFKFSAFVTFGNK